MRKDSLSDRVQRYDQLSELVGSQGWQISQTSNEFAVILERLDGKFTAFYLFGIF